MRTQHAAIARGLAASSIVLAASLAACTSVPPAAPPATTLDEQLVRDTTGPVIVERDVDGTIRGIAAEVPVTGATPEERARDFLSRYGASMDVEGDTRTVDVVEGDASMGDDTSVVVFEETHGGVVVYGSDVRVEVGADEAVAATAHTPSVPPPATMTASVSETAARAAVEALIPGVIAGPGELVIVNVAFLTGEGPGVSRLAWKIEGERTSGSAPLMFIDALDGTVLLRLEQMIPARRRRTYDAQNSADIANLRTGGGLLVYEERALVAGVMPAGDVTTVHDLVGGMWTYYWDTFKRDAHDGRGGVINSYANFDTTMNNAFWYRDSLWIMNGLATADIIGHELTHGLVEKTARLPYLSWSGALNEHYADVFGVMYDRDDWNIGEGSGLGVLRSFSDPTSHAQPRAMSGAQTWPAGTVPNPATNDNLGVHGNSGIFNHATYLMSEGGTHADSGIAVTAIGREKTEQIHFRALTWYMGGASRPVDARIAIRLAAYRFAQKNLHGVTPEDCGAVINAYAAVGIGGVDTDNDCFADTVDNCPMDANFDQADANRNRRGDVCEVDAGPRCQRHLQRCEMDTDCCNAAPGGSWICELGQCVDGAMCVRVGTECAANSDCCEGVRCQNIGSASGPKQCCARSSDVCTSNDQCCGAMQCTAGECACRAVGESCVTTLDCCGSSFCKADGTCGTGS